MLKDPLPNVDSLLIKYPDKIPVIVTDDKNKNSHRFLISDGITIAKFLIMFRRKINIDSNQSIYFYVNHNKSYYLVPTSSTFSSLYITYKNNDKILMMKYAKENVFG
jgi:hypothetical protein